MAGSYGIMSHLALLGIQVSSDEETKPDLVESETCIKWNSHITLGNGDR